jgi:hypothetical protein
MNLPFLRPFLFVSVLSTLLFGQADQKPASRPESFEWNHPIELFDEAFNDTGNFVEAERFARRSLEIAEQLQLGDEKRATSSLRFISQAESFRRSAALRRGTQGGHRPVCETHGGFTHEVAAASDTSARHCR